MMNPLPLPIQSVELIQMEYSTMSSQMTPGEIHMSPSNDNNTMLIIA